MSMVEAAASCTDEIPGPVISFTEIPGGGYGVGWTLNGVWEGCHHDPEPCGADLAGIMPCLRLVMAKSSALYGGIWMKADNVTARLWAKGSDGTPGTV